MIYSEHMTFRRRNNSHKVYPYTCKRYYESIDKMKPGDLVTVYERAKITSGVIASISVTGRYLQVNICTKNNKTVDVYLYNDTDAKYINYRPKINRFVIYYVQIKGNKYTAQYNEDLGRSLMCRVHNLK